jgi:phosphatidylglycerophosphate synthase
LAAFLLALFHRVPLTPNGYSVVGLGLGLAMCVAFAGCPGQVGLVVAWILCQASFTVDCMDGMRARYDGLASRVGLSFDYLVDSIKQFALFPCVAFRLSWDAGAGFADPVAWLGLGWEPGPTGWLTVAALAGPLVAAPLFMTSFVRSPAYTGEAGQQARPRRNPAMRAISFLLNYPSWLLIPVLFARLDVFLFVSLPLFALYGVYTFASICRKIVPMSHYRADA